MRTWRSIGDIGTNPSPKSPPPPPPRCASGVGCNHKYVHLETVKTCNEGAYYKSENVYTKVDRYFCEKCLDTKEVTKTEVSVEKPFWY